MEKTSKLLALNSKEQNDKFLYDLILNGKMDAFFNCISKGYPLSAFVLNAVYALYDDGEVDKALKQCCSAYDDIYEFIVEYKGRDEAHKFIVEHNFMDIAKSKLSKEELFKYGLYDLLFTTWDGKWHYQMHAPTEDVLKNEKCFPICDRFFKERITTTEEYAIVYNSPHKGKLALSEGGQKFLFKKGDYNLLISYIIYHYIAVDLGFESPDECLEHILNKKGALYFFNCDHYEVYRFLLRYAKKHPSKSADITSLFVEAKMWKYLAEAGFYDCIDWQDFSSSYPFEYSKYREERWKYLQSQGAYAELWRYKQRWRAIKAMFH